MKVTVYCFLPGVKFDPLPKAFAVKDGEAWIGNDFEPNREQKKQEIVGSFLSYATDANIEDFLRVPEDPDDREHKAQFEKIQALTDRYRGELNEVATLVEGLVSTMSAKPFPSFLIQHVNVRLTPENPEEEKLIADEKVHHTFGDIGKSRENRFVTVGDADEMLRFSHRAEERLSALSIYTLAIGAEERFELEIAYLNFFRIIEGYLGGGTPRVEEALQKESARFVGLLKPDEKFLKELRAVLSYLGLPSKTSSVTDAPGIVSDLVLLRHKLAHYNLTHQDKHFYASMRLDLKVIVCHLHRAAHFLIRSDIGG